MCGYNATIPVGKEFGVCEACDSPVVRPTATSANDAPAGGHAGNADALLRRALLLLEHSDWEKAKEVIDQALNINPENAKIYVAQLMAETESKKEEDLRRHREQDLAKYQSYGKAMRFADADLKVRLEGYREFVLKRQALQREAAEKVAEERRTRERKAALEEAEAAKKTAAARAESAKKSGCVTLIVVAIIVIIGVVYFLISNANERERTANLERFIELSYVIELLNEEKSIAQIKDMDKDMNFGFTFIDERNMAILTVDDRVQYFNQLVLHFTHTENPILTEIVLTGVEFFEGIEISAGNVDAMQQHFSERYDVEVSRISINLDFQVDEIRVGIRPTGFAGTIIIRR